MRPSRSPWPDNSDLHYGGARQGFSMMMAFTAHEGTPWEVIEPTAGESIYPEFVDRGAAGFHHVAVDRRGVAYADRVRKLKRRGYSEVRGGHQLRWRGPVRLLP